MDEIDWTRYEINEARCAGYRTAIEHNDMDVDTAYNRWAEGSTKDSPEYKYFAQGYTDAASSKRPIITVPDFAKLANVSGAYIRQEIANGRLHPIGEGKNRRFTYDQFLEWLSNPLRGSRSKSNQISTKF